MASDVRVAVGYDRHHRHWRNKGEDYEPTLITTMTDKMAAHGQVRSVLSLGLAFEGYSPDAAWRDTRSGVAHLADFKKVAVVSNVPRPSRTGQFFAPFIRFLVRAFAASKLGAA